MFLLLLLLLLLLLQLFTLFCFSLSELQAANLSINTLSSNNLFGKTDKRTTNNQPLISRVNIFNCSSTGNFLILYRVQNQISGVIPV